ncbi:MAG: hypothetical protein U5L06_06800 [Rhodovibrio sp.]|nr:hypothetical protein [Rhodovibrio sp.]
MPLENSPITTGTLSALTSLRVASIAEAGRLSVFSTITLTLRPSSSSGPSLRVSPPSIGTS